MNTPPVISQLNVDYSQDARFVMFAPAVNFQPFEDANNESYAYNDLNNAQLTALHSQPTMFPIPDATMNTTEENYNAANLSPWTYMNYAQAPYGNARGQLSLITDVDLNRPGKLLPVNNGDMFKQVRLDEAQVKVPQKTRFHKLPWGSER